jgi:hypothetical protein
MIIVRYADDFIVGFQHESDAQRFLNEMRERLREFEYCRPSVVVSTTHALMRRVQLAYRFRCGASRSRLVW